MNGFPEATKVDKDNCLRIFFITFWSSFRQDIHVAIGDCGNPSLTLLAAFKIISSENFPLPSKPTPAVMTAGDLKRIPYVGT